MPPASAGWLTVMSDDLALTAARFGAALRAEGVPADPGRCERFARAVFPAQAVAFSSRTSLAALPALIEGAQRPLGMTAEAAGFLLPLASALFRVGAAIGLTVGAVFIGRLYATDLTSTQVATVAITAVLTSFSIPGIPGGSIVAMVPVLASVGLPIDGIGVLLGVEKRTSTGVAFMITELYVDAAMQRHGVGALLMNALVKRLKARGIHTIALLTSCCSTRSPRTYLMLW